MEENRETVENPEEKEMLKKAYGWYQGNIRKAGSLVYDLTKGARSGMSDEALLEIALEAIERMAGTELRRKWDEKNGAGE